MADMYIGSLDVAPVTTPTPTPTPPVAIFDYFSACAAEDCAYRSDQDIIIATNRVKNVGDIKGVICIKFEELDASGNPLSGGVSCSDCDNVESGECVSLYYDEYTNGCGLDFDSSCSETRYARLKPRSPGTYYFGMKVWSDNESEPSYPVPDSPDQPANAKAWSIVCELPTPTPTPTATPTPSPTPTRPPRITGECVFPRILTGTLTPRLDKGVVFYRMRCLIDKWI